LTPSEIIDRARTQLDDVAEPYLWSDDELIDCLNKALTLFLNKTQINKSYDSLSVGAGVSTIQPSNSTYLIGISEVKFDGSPLDNVDLEYITTLPPTSDVPRIYTFENNLKSIHLYPAPYVAGTLTFKRSDNIEVKSSNLNTELPFDKQYHLYLIDGVCAFAFLKNDTETLKVDQSQRFMALFTNYIEEVKRYTLLNSQSFRMVSPVPRGLL